MALKQLELGRSRCRMFDSPGVLVGPGTPFVNSGIISLTANGNVNNSTTGSNGAGTYTLSQSFTLSNLNSNAILTNFTASSSVMSATGGPCTAAGESS